MNTVDQAISTLKQNPALLHSLSQLLDFAQLGPQPDELYRERETELLELVRQFSCQLQSLAMSAWVPQDAAHLLREGQLFERTHTGPKTYVGLHGPFELTRSVYRCRATGESLCPLEQRAGIVEGHLTPAAARLELMSAACDDYRMAHRLHQAAFVLGRSKSAMQRDVEAMGAKLELREAALEAVRRDSLHRLEGVASLSVSVDRTGLPFEEPLARGPGRPKKGAPKRPCQVVHRQVYCASLTLHDAKGRALGSQRFAGLPGQGERVVAAARRGLEALVQQYPQAALVSVCDGAAEMQEKAAKLLEGYEVEARLVDAWHAAGYVSRAFLAAGWSQAKSKEMVRRLMENKTGVSENLTRLRTLQLEGSSEAVDEAERYLSNHAHQMNYALARQRGLPIGSGSVEATCKCVVAVRFKRSGARWKAAGALPLLKTRAWMSSSQQVWQSICDAFLDTYVTQDAA